MLDLLSVDIDVEEVGTESGYGGDGELEIVTPDKLDILEADISEHYEEIVGLESQVTKAIGVYNSLSDEIENDKLIYDSQTFTLGTESVLKSYEDALFDIDIMEEDLGPIIGLESATNDAETFLVGLEAKDSLLTTISIKIRKFIKAIRRALKKLFTSSMVYLGSVGKDVSKLGDKVDELEDSDGVIFKGKDADSDLNNRVKKILNFYLSEDCVDFSKATYNSAVYSLPKNPIIRAVELIGINAFAGYKEPTFEVIKEVYESYVDEKDTDAKSRTTGSIQRQSATMLRHYGSTLGNKSFPSSSSVRKIVKKHEDETIIVKATIRPEKVIMRLLVDHKPRGGKRSWSKVTGEQTFRTNNVELSNLTHDDLKSVASTALDITTSFDLKVLVNSSFDLLKDLDDDLAEAEARNKGSDRRLKRLRAVVDFSNSNVSDFIFATLANSKAIYRLLRTLVDNADTLSSKDKKNA